MVMAVTMTMIQERDQIREVMMTAMQTPEMRPIPEAEVATMTQILVTPPEPEAVEDLAINVYNILRYFKIL